MSMEGLNAPLAPHDDLGARQGGDYKNTEAMIFGEALSCDAILASIEVLEEQLNRQ